MQNLLGSFCYTGAQEIAANRRYKIGNTSFDAPGAVALPLAFQKIEGPVHRRITASLAAQQPEDLKKIGVIHIGKG